MKFPGTLLIAEIFDKYLIKTRDSADEDIHAPQKHIREAGGASKAGRGQCEPGVCTRLGTLLPSRPRRGEAILESGWSLG